MRDHDLFKCEMWGLGLENRQRINDAVRVFTLLCQEGQTSACNHIEDMRARAEGRDPIAERQQAANSVSRPGHFHQEVGSSHWPRLVASLLFFLGLAGLVLLIRRFRQRGSLSLAVESSKYAAAEMARGKVCIEATRPSELRSLDLVIRFCVRSKLHPMIENQVLHLAYETRVPLRSRISVRPGSSSEVSFEALLPDVRRFTTPEAVSEALKVDPIELATIAGVSVNLKKAGLLLGALGGSQKRSAPPPPSAGAGRDFVWLIRAEADIGAFTLSDQVITAYVD